MIRRSAISLLLLFAALAFAAAPKVEPSGPCNDAAVPDAVKKVLAPDGYKVTLDDGNIVTVWPRAQITTAAKARNDAGYNLPLSELVGVIHFDKNTKDYRGNPIQAGSYNLRYMLQPADGDHLGTAPTVDFLLLIPPAQDTDPNATYNFDQIVALSRQVTGKKHPAPFNLMPPDAKQFPSVATDNEEHAILQFKLKAASGDVPMALVVKGTTTE